MNLRDFFYGRGNGYQGQERATDYEDPYHMMRDMGASNGTQPQQNIINDPTPRPNAQAADLAAQLAYQQQQKQQQQQTIDQVIPSSNNAVPQANNKAEPVKAPKILTNFPADMENQMNQDPLTQSILAQIAKRPLQQKPNLFNGLVSKPTDAAKQRRINGSKQLQQNVATGLSYINPIDVSKRIAQGTGLNKAVEGAMNFNPLESLREWQNNYFAR